MDTLQNKITLMIETGFNIQKCNFRKIYVLQYKGYAWTFDEIDNSPYDIIKRAILIYISDNENEFKQKQLNKLFGE